MPHTQIALAPAKINLGLEVVRRREDGLHEVATILQTITLFDRFVWEPRDSRFEYASPDTIPSESDLVQRVFATATDRLDMRGRLHLEKHIPASAGLGGGSSDAALALLLAHPTRTAAELEELAQDIGSDVPFFLDGGCALATGTGTTLQPLTTPDIWFVVVSPHLLIPSKTRTLYGSLVEGDFSDGAIVLETAARLERGEQVAGPFPNAFERSLRVYPEVSEAMQVLEQAGAESINVSGAGPSVYTTAATFGKAAFIARRIPPVAGTVTIARTLPARTQRQGIEDLATKLRR